MRWNFVVSIMKLHIIMSLYNEMARCGVLYNEAVSTFLASLAGKTHRAQH